METHTHMHTHTEGIQDGQVFVHLCEWFCVSEASVRECEGHTEVNLFYTLCSGIRQSSQQAWIHLENSSPSHYC